MKIFLDSANLEDIAQALARGFPVGITTNPSILSKEPLPKEPKTDFREHVKRILDLVQRHGYDIPVSVEVSSTNPREVIAQAEEFLEQFGNYKNINVKVPIGWEELGVIHQLRKYGVKINCICCMSYNQAIMAADAGANYVSLFYGRIRDVGYDAASIVRQVHQTFREWRRQAKSSSAVFVTSPISMRPFRPARTS